MAQRVGVLALLGLLLGCGGTTTVSPPEAGTPDVGVVAEQPPTPVDVPVDVLVDHPPGAEDTPAPTDLGADDVLLDAAVPDAETRDTGSPDTGPADVPAVAPDRPRPTGRQNPPPLRPYSRGQCPSLRVGPNAAAGLNMGFRTGSQTRQFRVIVPRNYDGTEAWPVLFAWHWLNASSASFVRTGELETAAEEMRFIAVLPDGLSDYVFDWPFAETWGVPGELTFFDDMLACVSGQLRVDPRRVYGTGVSAGGLWLTYLSTSDRADYFAAINVMSGGLGEVPFAWRMEYRPQAHKFPAIVLWGGPSDWLGLSFADASTRYRDALLADQHFVVQCVHSSGHEVPPVPSPADGGTRFRPLWRFLLDHPYGLAPGASPYFAQGLPAGMPSWCTIASPRP